MISLHDHAGGGPKQDPAPTAKHTVQKDSMPDTSNQFGVVSISKDRFVIKALPSGMHLTKSETINLAAWLICLTHGEKEFWQAVEKISQCSTSTEEGHKLRHEQLHRALDELLADWFSKSNALPSITVVSELMRWSHQQTINPTK